MVASTKTGSTIMSSEHGRGFTGLDLGAAGKSMDPGPSSVKGAAGEVARVLAAPDLYAVLELDAAADEAAVRKARHAKMLAVHPDKLPPGTPGSEQAFQRVQQVGLHGMHDEPGLTHFQTWSLAYSLTCTT